MGTLAEACDGAYDTLVNTRLSDAGMALELRNLYGHNPLRLMADIDGIPVGLMPSLYSFTGRTTGLTYVALRTTSNTQREAMCRIDTKTSLTLTSMMRGNLWGLIIYHHAMSRSLSFEVHTACGHLTQIPSLQTEAKEGHAEIARRLELRRIPIRLLTAMTDHNHSHEDLLEHPANPLHFTSTNGAVIVRQGECVCIGTAPGEAGILCLTE